MNFEAQSPSGFVGVRRIILDRGQPKQGILTVIVARAAPAIPNRSLRPDAGATIVAALVRRLLYCRHVTS